MKLKVIFLAVAMLNSTASIAQVDYDKPDWLVKKLEIYQKYDPLIIATKTEYNGKVAYYISPRCCDIPSELYDESGTLICFPGGGLAGGDGKCPSFGQGKHQKSTSNQQSVTK